ncbi:MAG: SMP-30/gluconolactonase/LRE family protein [Solirubrobacteraceae bacterium]
MTRLLSARTAQVAIGHHARGVVESKQPMAVETSPGHFAPVDLALQRVGGAFESVRPVVGVLIPSHASEGVQLPDAGVSLTPANARGGSLAGSEGAMDGASVIFANTQTDEDTVVAPTTMGVALNAMLRSVESPNTLYYRVGLPSGARLVQGEQGAPARVVAGEVTLGLIMPPTAVDAAGQRVPVTMSVINGDMLSLQVHDASGAYQFPISVDPEYVWTEDRSLTGAVWPVEPYKGGWCENWEVQHCASNWKPVYSSSFSEAHTYKASYSCGLEEYWCNQSFEIQPNGAYNGGEYAGVQYKTQGESTVYDLEMWVEGYNEPSETTTEVEYNYGPNAEGRDNHVLLSGGSKQAEYKYEPLSMTSGYFHEPLETPRNNDVRLMDYTTKHESLYGFWTDIWAARVYVAQEDSKHPEVESTTACPHCGFNTASSTIAGADNRTNVLYGAGSWLGPNSGAFEVSAHDPGIGVSFVALEGPTKSEERFIRNEEGKCLGIQCSETYSSPDTYLPSMPEGEDGFRFYAEDAAGLYGDTSDIVKVDARPPENLEVTGWSSRREISAAMHTLTISATDSGPEKKKSSGVKSITVSIDGGTETTIAGASCSEGPCTGSGSYTLHAENLSEGVHRLVETATDNADNVSAKEFTFDVRHASPVAVGPGAVDPTTGQFTLNATDVSLGGVAAVARTYQSRDLTAGSEGPLGPQWAVNLGASQSLVRLPEGAVALTASGGGRTTFASKGKGEYESPLGDENLTLESKEEKAGQGISEYLLKDAKAGTTTVFTQPAGTEKTMPIYANQFGQEGTNMGRPVSAAVDANGDVWVTDYTSDRVLEFSSGGVLLKEFGSAGEWLGNFKEPWGIAINKSTGNVYVSDPGNSRIVELNSSGQFVRAFGWAVKPGGERKEEFQDCTSYCQAGTAGTGAGQLDWPQGVAIDSSGDVWVAEYDSNRIQEFNAEGQYLHSYGSAGTGDGQFEGPLNIAFSGSDLYVTELNNNRLQELTTSGAFVKTIGWGVSNGEEKFQICTSGCRAGIAGAGKGQFNGPWGIALDAAGDLYVSDNHNDRVQELTSAGAFVTKFGSAGSGNGQFSEPMGIALGTGGEIYVADYANKRMQEWMRPTWMPARTEDALKHVATAYAYEPVEVEGKVVIDPTEVLAATPPGITCVGEHGEVEIRFLKDGCRALSFNYATATTAKGEGASEWGDYDGHLTRVYFHAYESVAKAMATREVAHYLYDSHGRLRAEWDPRTEPKPESDECAKEPLGTGCLATVYGYDEAGHVTAVTPPKQESWGLVYGTSAGDASTGRLLKVTRAPASTKLSNGEAPLFSEEPKLSGVPVVGVRMAVSRGRVFLYPPFVYGYQWEDCNAHGEECTAILGATNANYTPVSSDVGHTLVAQVTATNGGGTAVRETAASAVVAATVGSYTQTVDSGYSLNAVSCIPGGTTCVVSDSAGKALYATNVSASSAASWSSWSGPTGESPSEAVACASSSLCLLAAGKDEGNGGNLYYATSLGGSWSLAYSPSWGVDAISCVSSSFCVDGQDSVGYFRWSTSPASTSWNLQSQGSAATKAISCLSASFCAIADSKGSVHVATSESQVKSSSWTQTSVDGSTTLNGIACLSSSSCVAVDSAGNALSLKIESSGAASATKHDIDGTTSLTGVACPGSSSCVAVDTTGHVLLTKNSGETWSTLYSLGGDLTSVSCASSSLCMTADTEGKVIAFNLTGTLTEGEVASPQPGTTVEYRVPVSGGGVPQNLSKGEVEKWGQKDDPAEGTAIFAPDEPQSWPASKYTRATIDYIDEEGRTVNTVAPTGGVTTTEYNEANEVTRTLSPDDRATAMAEGCISLAKKECKSAEAAEKLSTQTEYNEEDSQIIKVLGPEHKIKLSNGTEVQARAITRNYYNEGAEPAEEKNHEEYNLLTKSTSGALLSNGEEKNVRTTLTSYSGQEYLGWKLRQPTSTTVDPTGLDMVSSTKYNKETGDVDETRSPGGNAETVSPPQAGTPFGGLGSGNGQMNEPVDTAVGPEGDVYVVDQENRRIEKFTGAGGFLEAFTVPAADKELDNPNGIAVAADGDIYIADTTNNRVVVLNKEGKFVEAWTHPEGPEKTEAAMHEPVGVAVTPAGMVFVSNYGSDEVFELNQEGKLVVSFGGKGAIGGKGTGNGKFEGPGLLAFSEGVLYVADTGNKRVEKFSTATGGYLGQFGSAGTGEGQFEDPSGIAVAPATGDLYVSDEHENRVQQFSPAGKFLASFGYWGSENAALKEPEGLSISTSGKLYVADTGNNRVSVWSLPEAAGLHETYSTQFGTAGDGPGQFEYAAAPAVTPQGHVLVTDAATNLIQEFSSQGKYLASYGGTGESPGKFEEATGIAVNQATGDMYVGDCGAHSIQELNPKGEYIRSLTSSDLQCPGEIAIDSSGDVWTGDMSADQVEEWSEAGSFLHVYGEKGEGDLQFNNPAGIIYANKDIYVADSGNNRVQVMSTSGAYVGQFGSQGTQGGEFEHPEGLAADASGDVFVLDSGNDRIQEFSPTDKYIQSIGTHGVAEGQLNGPQSIAVTAADDIYVTDAQNHRVEKWTPDSQAVHDTKTIYYSPEKEAGVEVCENHPEWASLPCRTEPVAQPEDAKEGDPSLPVSTMTYNIWDEVLVTKEEFGTGAKAPVREKIETYDVAGRALTSEEKAFPAGEEGKPIDTALPKVTNEYNTETGALEKQSATIKGETKTTTAKDNTLGQLIEYKDATGNIAKYTYEEGSDARLLEVSEGKGEEAASKQTYTYNAETGFMTKLVDSAAGTFTASYDLEGKMTSEIYPNGMCANTSYNTAGQATSISYIKTRNCSEEHPTVWFSDSIVSGIHGETLAQESTLAKESYAYDTTGRLLETQETPAGKGCTTRLYAYDEESNRLSQTTREPASEGKCATEGGTVQRHVYDEANRLTDEGIEYEPLGNATTLPGADAEGHEIKSSYYVDGQVASQEQNGVQDSYLYDPAGRTMETTSEVKATKATATHVSHYAGPGESVTWTSEGAEKWSRNIPGIGGSLQATEESTKVVTLQLTDLQGNIIATAADNETETKLRSTYNSTEFGVPTEGKTPPKYAWLGAGGLATETAFGTGVATQGGASYIPQVACDLQTAPVVPPGAFPNGIGGGEQYTATISAGELASAEATAKQIYAEAEAARQESKEQEAEEAASLEEARLLEGGVDPTMSISLSGKLTKWLARSLAFGVPIVSRLISKYGDALGTIIADALEAAGGASVEGLNKCYEAYKAATESKEYSCKIVYHYLALPGPPYTLPEELVFENCYSYKRYKKEKESCIRTYSIGWKNLL